MVDCPLGTRWKERYRIDDDRFLPGLTELAEAIHSHGCPTFLQLWHDGPWQSPLFAPPAMFDGPAGGRVTGESGHDGRFPPRQAPGADDPARSRTSSTSSPARRCGRRRRASTASTSTPPAATCCTTSCRRSGTDAQDEYGGSVENRARFTVEIVREMKRRTGPDFAVTVLMNAIELGRAFEIPDALCLSHDEALQHGAALRGRGRRRDPGAEPLAGLPRGRLLPRLPLLSRAADPDGTLPQGVQREPATASPPTCTWPRR